MTKLSTLKTLLGLSLVGDQGREIPNLEQKGDWLIDDHTEKPSAREHTWVISQGKMAEGLDFAIGSQGSKEMTFNDLRWNAGDIYGNQLLVPNGWREMDSTEVDAIQQHVASQFFVEKLEVKASWAALRGRLQLLWTNSGGELVQEHFGFRSLHKTRGDGNTATGQVPGGKQSRRRQGWT